MRTFKTFARMILYFCVHVTVILIATLFQIVLFWSKERLWRHLSRLTHLWGKLSCRVMNIRVKFVAEAAIPDAPLIVSNHLGIMDSFVLARCFKTFFIVGEGAAKIRLVKSVVRGLQFIVGNKKGPHDNLKMISEIQARLSCGQPVLCFPETGVTDGEEVLPFKSMAFESVIRNHGEVLPVYLHYHGKQARHVAFGLGISFSRFMYRLFRTEKIEVTVHLLPPLKAGPNRQRLARTAWSRIVEIHAREMDYEFKESSMADRRPLPSLPATPFRGG